MKFLFLFLFLYNFSYGRVIDDYLDTLKEQAIKEQPLFNGFDKIRGEKIFTSKHIGRKGKEISCTSCHGIDLTESHENFFTGKLIKPLSPKTNIERLSNLKDIKKWLRRNFIDVYNREGTAIEKGDVLTYIITK